MLGKDKITITDYYADVNQGEIGILVNGFLVYVVDNNGFERSSQDLVENVLTAVADALTNVDLEFEKVRYD